ncbi:MAG: hypothetical protein WC980_00880 [Candidatus Brocadiia bacterium]
MEENRSVFWEWLKDLFIRQNVFYLMSALFMILGCYLALKPFQQITRSLADLIIYFALINTYEALLVVAAIYVIVKKNVIRDGTVLLLIEGFFLVDATLMNSVYHLYSIWAGIIFNLMILGLAALKIQLVARYLKLDFPKAFYRFIGLGLAYLYLFTAFISYGIKQAYDSTMLMFIVWSVAGLIPVVLIGIAESKEDLNRPFAEFCRKAQVAFSLIVMCLLLIHLATATWIASAPFYLCYLVTFLISFAFILPELKPRLKAANQVHWFQYALITASILFCIEFPKELIFKIPVIMSPLRLALIMTAVVFASSYWAYKRKVYLAYSVFFIGNALLGYSFSIIWDNLTLITDRITGFLPDSNQKWGIFSIIAAFMLLVFGFLVSLNKSKMMAVNEGGSVISGKRQFMIILLVLVIGFSTYSLAIALIERGNRFYEGGGSAISALRALAVHEDYWKQNDIDGNGIKDFWTLDISCLHRLYQKDGKNKIDLIDASFARADDNPYARGVLNPFNLNNAGGMDMEDWSLPKFSKASKYGYVFRAIALDEDGVFYNQNPVGHNNVKAGNSNKFAFAAYPEHYPMSGKDVYIINESGKVYATDPGTDEDRKIVLKWPGIDPTKVKGPGNKSWVLVK